MITSLESTNPVGKKGPVMLLGEAYTVAKREPERPKDRIKNTQDHRFLVTDNRNELERAQKRINKSRLSIEGFDMKKVLFPVWRSVEKDRWISPSKSFEYKKPETNVLKLKQDKLLSKDDPYVDPDMVPISRSVVGHLSLYSKFGKKEWDPKNPDEAYDPRTKPCV